MDERRQGEGGAALSVDDVLITDELARRPSRRPDYAAENRALVGLSEELTANPEGTLQRVVELVLRLCHADSAGISVLEGEGGEEVFRWCAAAGRFAHHLHGTMPRSASPCGTVITRNRVLLFNEAERFFPALRGVQPRIYENLLAPWEVNGEAGGTVWAIKHTPEGRFDAEDARLLSSFARFAGAAHSFVERTRQATAERRAALNLMEDAIAARREAEQAYAALRVSEEKYRTLFNSMDEAYAVVEVMAGADGAWNDFLFLEVNPAFVKQTGMQYPVGRRATELLGTPNPRWMQVWGRVAETGEAVRFEESEPTLGRVFDLYAFRFGGEGSRRVAVLFTDITARRRAEEALRESEERFRAFVAATTDAVYRMSPDWGEIRYLAGKDFVPDTEWPSQSWVEKYIHPDDQPQVLEAIREAVRTKSVFELEHRVRRADGGLGWVLSRAVPLVGESGEVVEWFGAASDVTSRRAAEEALRESEARLHSIANLVPDLLWESAPDGSTNWYNLRWAEYSGQNLEQAVGWGWVDAIHPEDREASARLYREAVERGEPLRQEHRIRRRDGVYRWFVVNAFPLKDARGRVVKMYGAATDIHEQRMALEAVRESQERLQKAVSIETVGVIFFDMGGRIQGANEAFARMSGYPRETFARGDLRWDELTPPEFMEASLGAVEELLTRGESTPYEKQYVRPDGSRWWGLFAGKRVSENECVEFVLDVTERRRAEEALRESEERNRLIVEGAVDYAIITTDPRGLITSWSPGAEKVLGWTADEAVGRRLEMTFTPEDRDAGAPAHERATAGEQGVALDVRWHLRRDGERVFIDGVTRALRDAVGGVRGFLKVGQDVTERRRSEEALRRVHEELEERVRGRTLELAEANVSLQQEVRERAAAEGRVRELLRQLVTVQEEERRRLARELHDTLGQQLSALRLGLALFRSQADAGPGVGGEAERMQKIFDRLDSDIDFLAWELRPAELDQLGLDAALRSYVREWSGHFGVPAEYHGFSLEGVRLPPEVETNLYRILQEALQNVHKHAGATHVSVQLDRRGGQVVLVVEDDGRGFDPEEGETDGDRGMGLVNMRERAALVGGSLEIESGPGAGTTLYVRVPAGGDGRKGEA